MSKKKENTASTFTSRLESPAQAWIAELLHRTLEEEGTEESALFLDHFGLNHILEALRAFPKLRVKLLVGSTGTHERIAAKKSTASAFEDLQLALDEGATSANRVIGLLSADQWLSALGAEALWKWLSRSGGWLRPDEEGEARELAGRMIQWGVERGIFSGGSAAAALPLSEVKSRLSSRQLRTALDAALEDGHAGVPFTAERLLNAVGHEAILESVGTDLVWSRVIVPALEKALASSGSAAQVQAAQVQAAQAQASQTGASHDNANQTSAPKDSALQAEATPVLRPTSSIPVAEAAPKSQSRPVGKVALAVPELKATPIIDTFEPEELDTDPLARAPAPPPRFAAPPSAPPPQVKRSRVPPPLPPPRRASEPAPTEGPKRVATDAVVGRLQAIGRLPHSASELPLSILYSIESMYTDLAATDDAAEQLAIMQDCFPNELVQREAMLALLELHDPQLFAEHPELAEEDGESLAVRLLTEERQRSAEADPNESLAARAS